MKTQLRLTIAAFGLAIFDLSAATLYVSLESTNPSPPYATWETAANVIQDAVDAARAGDTVLVTNGVYATGGRTAGTDILVSRVAVDKPLTVLSVNGPQFTIIQGAKAPGGGNGEGAVRGVYLTNDARLFGFTLTGGDTRVRAGDWRRDQSGGGLLCEGASAVVTDCVLTGNSAWVNGGGAFGGTLNNCTFIGNSASWRGGGASGDPQTGNQCTLNNCTLSGNSADYYGGAASGSTLNDCTLSGNSARGGGGAIYCALKNCTFTVNGAVFDGGGALNSTLDYCTLTGNSARSGGGAYESTLSNCTLTGNGADSGGGANLSTLNNCTLTGNSAGSGGGVKDGMLSNCIVYFNTAGEGANYSGMVLLNYCCTRPLPSGGLGNIDADPMFEDAAHGDLLLRPGSPCIDAGTNLLSLITTDLNGNARPLDGNKDGVAAFDIGAYEFRPSPVRLYVSLESTNPVSPYATWETAATNIQDAVEAAQAGDRVLVTNGMYAVGGKDLGTGFSKVTVANAITLESVNGPSATVIDGGSGVRCVYLANGANLSGFTLTNGVAGSGGGVFCESVGTVVSNCVVTGNTALGFINGGGGGAYGGTLYNCTLTDNTAPGWIGPHGLAAGGVGGGAASCTLNNCTLSGNTAQWRQGIVSLPRPGTGGGAANCTLNNCTLTGNSATDRNGFGVGGGAYSSTLYNCMVTGNYGGGASASSTLYNCVLTGNEGGSDGIFYNCTVVDNNGGVAGAAFNSIIYYNSGGNYRYPQPELGEYWLMELSHCCTTPLPTNGVGNITGPPLFMDMAAGDFRLWEGSPCIDAGTNLVGFTLTITEPYTGEVSVLAYAYEPTDMLGNAWFIDGNGDGQVAWDIGAYEFDSFRPPRFAVHPQLTAEGWRLTVTGAAGQWARLQRSSDLKNWEGIWSGFMGAAGVQQVNDRVSYDEGQPVMFYRVVVW